MLLQQPCGKSPHVFPWQHSADATICFVEIALMQHVPNCGDWYVVAIDICGNNLCQRRPFRGALLFRGNNQLWQQTMATILIFVASGMLPRPTILVAINYGNNSCFRGIRHVATTHCACGINLWQQIFQSS